VKALWVAVVGHRVGLGGQGHCSGRGIQGVGVGKGCESSWWGGGANELPFFFFFFWGVGGGGGGGGGGDELQGVHPNINCVFCFWKIINFANMFLILK
jgi:hypothetical protein